MHVSLFRKTPTGAIARRLCARPALHYGCTIRAYPAHAAELNNPNPEDVHFFYKPYSAGWQLFDGGVVPIPTRFQGGVHHEIEVCLLIGATPLPSPLGPDAKFDPDAVKNSIEGIGLGLDWTLRGIQQPLAKGGLPWERSKAFERSAALTEFVDLQPPTAATGVSAEEAKKANLLFNHSDETAFPHLQFSLLKNGKAVQVGDTKDISFCPLRQVWEMHRVTRLRHGDVVMTGTTTGVNPVDVGDKLQLVCERLGIDVKCTVVPEESVEGKL